MPGFVTHYLFGCESVKLLREKSLREILKKHKKVYIVGLQGPDLFFYCPYSFTGTGKRLGSVMHVSETGRFFENFLQKLDGLQGEERNIGIAYFSGFLGHYILDTVCHPFVYYFTGYLDKDKPYFGKHVDFETDIDCVMLKELTGRDVVDFHPERILALTGKESAVVADILHNVCKTTYPYIVSTPLRMKQALLSYRFMNGMLGDRKGIKKKIAETAEKTVFGHAMVSPLFVVENKETAWEDLMNRSHRKWVNPWDVSLEDTDSFDELFVRAQKIYIRLLEKVAEAYVSESKGKTSREELRGMIGNRSYHSGLDCSIPS